MAPSGGGGGAGFCAYFCFLLSSAGVCVLSIFGFLLLRHSPAFELPATQKTPGGWACFIAAGIYFLTAISCLISISRPVGEHQARIFDLSQMAAARLRRHREASSREAEKQTELRPLLTDQGCDDSYDNNDNNDNNNSKKNKNYESDEHWNY